MSPIRIYLHEMKQIGDRMVKFGVGSRRDAEGRVDLGRADNKGDQVLHSLLLFSSSSLFCVDTLKNGESCPPHFFRPVARRRTLLGDQELKTDRQTEMKVEF